MGPAGVGGADTDPVHGVPMSEVLRSSVRAWRAGVRAGPDPGRRGVHGARGVRRGRRPGADRCRGRLSPRSRLPDPAHGVPRGAGAPRCRGPGGGPVRARCCDSAAGPVSSGERSPAAAARIPGTVAAPIGTLADKARLVRLVLDVRRHTVPELLRRPDTTTAERLARAGFSERMMESFWQPLFAGIQLDPDLEVSSRRFDTILRMLAVGATGVPRQGMGAIPAQLASTLPDDVVRLGASVVGIDGSGVMLAGGEHVSGRAVVVATEGPVAHRLLGRASDPGSRAAACCWFAAAGPPLPGPLLMLDGEASGPARNVAVMSEVSPSYAPAGRALVAAAVPGPAALDPDHHQPGARAAGPLVRFRHVRLGAPANRRHRARPAGAGTTTRPQAAGCAGRGGLRVRRSS